MTIDNSKTIIGLRIKGFTATILFLVFIILTFFEKIIKFPVAGIQESTATIALASLYCIIVFMPLILRKMFIYYSDDGENIVVRYFFAGMIAGKKNSIIISKQTFAGYKIYKGFLGLFPTIEISQRVRNGIAKYPPISISSLNRKEKEKIFNSLNSYSGRL